MTHQCAACCACLCAIAGRDVYKSQGGAVPIGLMASDWGGQPIEPFMSPDALNDKTRGGTRNATGAVNAAARTDGNVSVGAASDPSVLWWSSQRLRELQINRSNNRFARFADVRVCMMMRGWEDQQVQ